MVSYTAEKIEYTSTEQKMMVKMINEINNQDTLKRSSFMEKFSLKQGINKFGQQVYEAAYGKMLQLHQRICFITIKVAGFNPRDRKEH